MGEMKTPGHGPLKNPEINNTEKPLPCSPLSEQFQFFPLFIYTLARASSFGLRLAPFAQGLMVGS